MDIMKVKDEQGNWVTVPAFQGQLGKTPSFSIGRVDLGTTPSSAAATITGTDEAPVLNLVLPKGIDGDAGSVGIAVQNTEPNDTLAWIDTSSTGNLISIPEIKDDIVNTTDTWSSAKIRDFAGLKDDVISDTNTWSSAKIRDFIYPVGSIYLSINNTNPSTIFGGTWEQIQDTFLLAAGLTYAAGDTGGEATHTLIVEEIPPHNHHILTNNDDFNNSSGGGYYGTHQDGTTAWYQTTWYTENTGGGQAHNNMPPYLVVYMWKRLS